MPELPEVENVAISLNDLGIVGLTFSEVLFLRPNLRTPLAQSIAEKLPGQRLLSITRRAKFLLFETEDYILLNHLGMTGSWHHTSKDEPLRKHDHIVLKFSSGLALIYNDPRRFGLLEMFPKGEEQAGTWLKSLGVEPLSKAFSSEFLFAKTRGKTAPLKSFIMDQRNVVGVGNIYASEALHKAGIKPLRQAKRLTRDEAAKLVGSVRSILKKAIKAGGSTIRDYRNSEGKAGSYQNRFSVYDRSGKPCKACGSAIRSSFVAGRNTFWCPKCQR